MQTTTAFLYFNFFINWVKLICYYIADTLIDTNDISVKGKFVGTLIGGSFTMPPSELSILLSKTAATFNDGYCSLKIS